MQLFVVGQVIAKTKAGFVWAFNGIYGDSKTAESKCKDKHWFVGPVELGSSLPDENVSWPGAYFPMYQIPEGSVE